MKTEAEIRGDIEKQSFYRLRRAIGIIGFLLPILLIFGSKLNNEPLEQSISAYFHTNMRDVFTGSLLIIGMFLIIYRGYPSRDGEWPSDRLLSAAAGAFCAMIAIFPVRECMGTDGSIFEHNCSFLQNQLELAFPAAASPTTYVHYGAAVLFFACLAIFCLVNFRRGVDTYTDPKKRAAKEFRNRIYYWCGIAIIASIALLAIIVAFDILARLFFWAEAVAVLAFAIAWLVKGRADEIGVVAPIVNMMLGKGANHE